MPNLILRSPWNLSEKLITPRSAFTNRRTFLREMGIAGAGLAAFLGSGATGARASEARDKLTSLHPAVRNADFNPDWKLSDQEVAASYNNFYEFTTSKTRVKRLVQNWEIDPWSIEIGGLCEHPLKANAYDFASGFAQEERVYRFRCVEAWAMIVPWAGFQLSKLIEKAVPKPEAKFVKFTTFNDPKNAPGFNEMPSYPWPYTEGLTMEEAMHPLAFVATGIYGEPLPKQHGAPIRMVVPWKYGYKSIKSIVKIEFMTEQPKTLWESLAPNEYPFESNVDPAVPHPRWSQATERMIDTGNRVRTKPYNGYGDLVAKLYN